jgi:hypothetical protein
MRHAARQFRNLGNKSAVISAPINDNFVFIHHTNSPNLYFKIT